MKSTVLSTRRVVQGSPPRAVNLSVFGAYQRAMVSSSPGGTALSTNLSHSAQTVGACYLDLAIEQCVSWMHGHETHAGNGKHQKPTTCWPAEIRRPHNNLRFGVRLFRPAKSASRGRGWNSEANPEVIAVGRSIGSMESTLPWTSSHAHFEHKDCPSGRGAMTSPSDGKKNFHEYVA